MKQGAKKSLGDRPFSERFCAGLSPKQKAQWVKPRGPSAFHLFGTRVVELASRAGSARKLPKSFVIPPGAYRVHGRTYTLREEGLYRFVYPLPARDDRQRIVFRRDVWAILSGLAWIGCHGNRDDGKSYLALKRQALTHKLICTCGCMAAFTVRLLKEHGILAREVSALSARQIKDWDRGHELVEVFVDNRWTLVDIDEHVVFRSGGRRLSALEAFPRFRTGDYTIERLAQSTLMAVGNFSADGYDYDLWMESTMSTEVQARRYYARIMDTLLLHQGGAVWALAATPAEQRAQELCYPLLRGRFLSRPAFIAKFYARRGQTK